MIIYVYFLKTQAAFPSHSTQGVLIILAAIKYDYSCSSVAFWFGSDPTTLDFF